MPNARNTSPRISAPPKYVAPASPESVGRSPTASRARQPMTICRSVESPSRSTTGSTRTPARAVREPEHGDQRAEAERLERLEPALGQGPRARAQHERVHVALEVLIQRERAAGRERGADQHVQQAPVIERAARADVVPDQGR